MNGDGKRGGRGEVNLMLLLLLYYLHPMAGALATQTSIVHTAAKIVQYVGGILLEVSS